MEEITNKYKIGDIVTFKSHPLLYNYMIQGDGKYVPPIMLIKEVHFENKHKKTHDENTGLKIAETIKYTCVYFDDNRSEFNESLLYESMLVGFTSLFIGRLDEAAKLKNNHVSLIDEILKYPLKPEYEYGKIIYLKTKKLEILKKRTSKTVSKVNDKDQKEKTTIQYIVNYSSPEFVINGFKKVTNKNSSNDGKIKRIVSTELVKVQWFNSFQQKFSEHLLPIECFTDIQPFKTEVPHNQIQHLVHPTPALVLNKT